MTSVQTSWQRIEAWLHTHAPALLEQLLPGVSDEDLAQAEALMGGLTPQKTSKPPTVATTAGAPPTCSSAITFCIHLLT